MKSDNDLFLKILHSPMNVSTTDTTTLVDKEKLNEQPEVQDKLEMDWIFSKPKVTSKKYKEQLTKRIAKNPSRGLVETERGKMRVTKAIAEGFDPRTGQFGEPIPQPSMEGMSPEMQEKLQMLMQLQGGKEPGPQRPVQGEPVEEKENQEKPKGEEEAEGTEKEGDEE